MRLDDEDIATAIACHALGFAQIGLGHLPGQKILSRRGEFLNAACHIDDIEIVLQIDRERARLIKLTKTGSARANDVDATEEFALEGIAVFARATGEQGNKRKSQPRANPARTEQFAYTRQSGRRLPQSKTWRNIIAT